MKNLTQAISYACLAVACGTSPAAAGSTAYVPVCCKANSLVSAVSTSQNQIAGGFQAGQGSYSVAFPSAGTAWVTNAGSKTISVVSVHTGATLKTIQLKIQPWLIAASPDGSAVYVVTGMFTGSLNHYTSNLEAFNARTGAPAGQVAVANDGLANPGLAVSPDGSRVYATFDSQTVIVYDVASQTIVSTWPTTRALTWSATGTLTLSPDGGTLYTAGQVITAFDTSTGAVLGTVNPPGAARTYSFVGTAITSDGSTLYASYAAQIGTGSGLAVIDTASLTVTASAGLGSELQEPVLSKDGSSLYVLDAISSLLYVVQCSNLTLTASVALQGPVATATLSADGSLLFVPNSSAASTLAVDSSTFSVTRSISSPGAPSAPTPAAGGARIFVGGISSNSVSEIHTATNKTAHIFTTGAQTGSVSGDNAPFIMATPNGRQVYIGTNVSATAGEIAVIDTASGNIGGVACPLLCTIVSMTALPDSSRVYAAGSRPFGDSGSRPIFYVIDTATLKVIAQPSTAAVGPMAASPSGAFLYIATPTGIQVFDTAQNTVTSTLPVSGVSALAFSPDGATVYAAAGGVLDKIDTASGTVSGSIGLGSIAAIGVTVSPDGSQVWVTPSKSTSVMVVNTQNQTIQSIDLGATVSGVAFGK